MHAAVACQWLSYSSLRQSLLPTSKISLKPRKSSYTTFLMCGTRLNIRRGLRHRRMSRKCAPEFCRTWSGIQHRKITPIWRWEKKKHHQDQSAELYVQSIERPLVLKDQIPRSKSYTVLVHVVKEPVTTVTIQRPPVLTDLILKANVAAC